MNDLKNKKANDVIPGNLFVPGEYIQDEMEAREMKQVDLAIALGMSKSEISLLLSGKRNITVLIAIKLEKIFDIDAETWMNIQVKYDIEKMKMMHAKELESMSLSPAKRRELKRAITAA